MRNLATHVCQCTNPPFTSPRRTQHNLMHCAVCSPRLSDDRIDSRRRRVFAAVVHRRGTAVHQHCRPVHVLAARESPAQGVHRNAPVHRGETADAAREPATGLYSIVIETVYYMGRMFTSVCVVEWSGGESCECVSSVWLRLDYVVVCSVITLYYMHIHTTHTRHT